MKPEEKIDEKRFATDSLFLYREREKRRSGILLLLTLAALGLLFFSLSAIQQYLPDSLVQPFLAFIETLSEEIRKGEVRGILLVSFTGGLFFFFLPLELLYLNYLKMGIAPWSLFLLYFLSLTGAQSFNYWVGFRLSRLVKLLIPPKKFYRLKGSLNHYGPWAILVINALPLPSPALSAVLGAFRYRLSGFYLFTLLGQGILYGGLWVVYHFVLSKTGELFL